MRMFINLPKTILSHIGLSLLCLCSLMITNLAAEEQKTDQVERIRFNQSSSDEKKSLKTEIEQIPAVTAYAMHGEPKLEVGFKHFPFANPKAPKGGQLKLASIGTFDSLNPYISTGTSAVNVDLIYDQLVVNSPDEPFSIYALAAESFRIPDDRSWAAFHIHPKAKFSDGTAITAEDILFSFETLYTKGRPNFQLMFLDVAAVDVLDPKTIVFRFKSHTNRELPLIIGTLPIFPKHFWQAQSENEQTFDKPSLSKPLGSGPYTVGKIKQGQSIQYVRDENYWGKDLPVNKGRYNFNSIQIEYFLDSNIALEAFKSQEYTLRPENNSKFWATGYSKANSKNSFKTTEIPTNQPVGMQGFVFNLRNPLFQDIKLREALGYAFDFEWSNKNLFYGQYKRTRSFFENTELSAQGLPSPEELKLLELLKDQIPERVFTEEYQPPSTDGSGRNRSNLRVAQKMLREAGYTLKNKQLFTPDGKKVAFEVILRDSGFERIVLPFIKNLKVLGVELTPKRVDLNQFIERLRTYDYDMFVSVFSQGLSPGNEQLNYWHSSAANRRDSQNYIGLKDPAIDQLVMNIVNARSRDDLVTATHALDRVLQWGFYVIPNWHVNYERIAYWPPITLPEQHPRYLLDLHSWWSAP